MTITALPDGAAATHHGVTVEHHPATESVVLVVHGERIYVTEPEGRDLAEVLAELFPSMAITGLHAGGCAEIEALQAQVRLQTARADRWRDRALGRPVADATSDGGA